MSKLIETRDKTLFKEIIDNPDHILSELLPGKRQKNLRKREHPFTLPNNRTERFKRSFVKDACLIISNEFSCMYIGFYISFYITQTNL